MRQFRLTKKRVACALVAVLALCVAIFPPFAQHAQRARDREIRLTNVSAHASGGGVIVTLTADAPLAHAQTWQDDEGFHVVGYRWVAAFGGTPRGVRLRHVGDSLEIVVLAQRGASVTVLPRGNSLDVVVSGGVGASHEPAERATAQTQPGRREPQGEQQLNMTAVERTARQPVRPARKVAREVAAAGAMNSGGATRAVIAQAEAQSKRVVAPQSTPAVQTTPATQSKGANAASQQPTATQQGAASQQANTPQQATVSGTAPEPQPNAQPSAQPTVAQVEQMTPAPPQLINTSAGPPLSGSLLTLSIVGVFLCVALGAFGFVYMRRRPAATEEADSAGAEAAGEKFVATKTSQAKTVHGVKEERPAKGEPKGATAQALIKHEGILPALTAPPVTFGAFRIEQEVEKMVRGEAHAIDVLAARAPDDRRAVETSLLKALSSPESSEPERMRARRALEEYGFVARQSAALLLAPDAYERSSAARSLGQIRSSAALPFLVEALHDSDTVVRTEAVASLGALGQPSAIGALLDLARRHPEVSPLLLSHALTSCSVDSIQMVAGGGGFVLASDALFSGEITHLEPAPEIEQLPEWLEDESLAEALERLESADVEARVAAAQHLAQFQVQRAVAALASMAAADRDASVRAAAVTSLGLIGHESVFTPVLLAMADEAREVRAAAARAFSRLNFDRADAYVRVVETADVETLRTLAEACVNAGLARQALDRLGSEDRRQSYEAFSLLSLVARGGQSEVILNVVKAYPDLKARLAAARLLALQGEEEVCARLRDIALADDTPEKLREAILEVVARSGQEQSGLDAAPVDGDKSVRPIA